MKTRFLAASLLVLLSTGANAATLYVEKWGRTTAGCGSRNDPCSTINAAIAQPGFGTNARIIVGPGIYPESVAFTMDGVRLESMAGARVTMLRTPDELTHVIYVVGDRARVGRRGKGFTLSGASQSPAAGIRIFGDRVRVEGNIVYGNHYGINVNGERPQIRYNEVRNNGHYALQCSNCERGIIEWNDIVDNFIGIGIVGVATRFQVRRNVVRNNTLSGIGINNSPNHEQFTIKDNAVEHNSTGIAVGNANGATIRGNLMGINALHGMRLDQVSFGKTVTVKDNIAMGNASENSDGFHVDIVQKLLFQGNSAIQNGASGLSIDNFSLVDSLKGNNFYANGFVSPNQDCAISNDSGFEPKLVQAFLGSPAGSTPGPDAQANDNDVHDTICGTDGYELPGNAYIAKPKPYRASAAARL